jgi:hypothetical protein
MSPRTRIAVVVTLAAVLAAAGAVLAARQGLSSGSARKLPSGPPRLYLDLGVRTDAEAQALRRAGTLYDKGQVEAARAIFSRYFSDEAQVGDAFAGWPAGTLARLRGLAAQDEASSFVQLHLALALLWSGEDGAAVAALQRATKAQPDTQSALTAEDLLHPNMVPGMPVFEPSFDAPRAVAALPAPSQLVALRARARLLRARAAHEAVPALGDGALPPRTAPPLDRAAEAGEGRAPPGDPRRSGVTPRAAGPSSAEPSQMSRTERPRS